MKVTANWLKQYVDFPWSAEELAERLTMLGLEVEGIEKLGGEFEGVVVAEVLSSEKHPNADKLSVCRVADGKGERQIVCGAKNYKVGDKVPLILPGASLPAKPGEPPFTIKAGKIRGVESQGMMCSPQELGLAPEADGLMILSPNAQVGMPFAQHLGKAAGDTVLDLEITPNRPDLNSLFGIAREISALTGNPLRWPDLPGSADSELPSAETLVRVQLNDPDLCPRYVARVIRGVRIGPSPDWLRQAVEKIGLRSINNVVDVTNYVMMEIGQPLHAFDYHLVSSGGNPSLPTIVVRRAAEGEKFTTLDGQEHTLTSEMLLIADPQRGIALAGIMGGQNSEISDQTVDVLLESAHFNPTNIRRTSKRLGLKTDASYRFERGADIAICDWANQRAAQLIVETAGGHIAPGAVDAYPQPFAPRQILLRFRKTDELLGIAIPPKEQSSLLERLGLERLSPPEESDAATYRIPTFRVDLKREVDLIEEITRLYGVDRIPPSAPRGALGTNEYDAIHDQLDEVRRLLTGLGLSEAQGQTLIGHEEASLTRTADMVALANPLSSDMDTLRPSLLPGLLNSLRHNLSHKNTEVALFELGRVFSRAPNEVREERRVAIALTGQRLPNFWQGADRGTTWDVYDLKGLLEEFFEQFGVRGLSYVRRPELTPLFVESATIHLGKMMLGELGQVQPLLAKRYDLRDAVVMAELNLDQLLARRNASKAFKPLPAFPSIRRDVALVVNETVTHDAVVQAVRQAKPAFLDSVELFDIYRGKNVPTGHKSVAYAFTYRHAERTLTDLEVNPIHEKTVEHLKRCLQASVRDA